jgi:hypothetical protein
MAGARRFVPRRDQVVAASLVGSVVVVVGFASGMGIRQTGGNPTLPARSGTSAQDYQGAIPGQVPGTEPPAGPVVPAIGPVGFEALLPAPQAGLPPAAGPSPGTQEPGRQPAPPVEDTPDAPACQPGLVPALVGTVLGGPTLEQPAEPVPAPTGGLVYQVVRGLLGTCPPLVQPGSGA